VRIVWRGGRAFKASTQASTGTNNKTNGAKDAVISLDDSDDEGPAAKAFEDKPEFEEEEEELDPSKPYPPILQTLDLRLGSDVLHLALLPAPALRAEGSSWRGLDPVKKKIVFTAACADNSLRLVTLPLTPPSPESKARPKFRDTFTDAYPGNGAWGETVVILGGHQKPSNGVAMTTDFGKNRQDSGSAETQIIVASHSREVTGLLLLYRISVKSPEPLAQPFQKIFLAEPARSISFNPFLSAQRSGHLLIADTTGVCRIYDYNNLTKSPEEGSGTSALEQGSFLLSLYTGFQNTKDQNPPHIGAHAGFGRKIIVDAQWVSSGAAILVLLSDGEWGLWDIEGVGPNKDSTIRGGSKSEYSLTGYIDTAPKSQSSRPPQISSSRFAPMTPSTRKSIEPFSTRGSSGPARGQISVVEIAAASPTNPSEESIVFWLGDTYSTIPSLAKYWAANARQGANGSGNLFNSPAGSRMLRLEGIDLQGERCSGIEQIPKSESSAPEILVLGEHRFAILTTGKQAKELKPRQPVEQRLVLKEKSANKGELDVVGIDQALSRMENGGSRRGKVF
jgi:hypothetical protein